MTDPIVWYLAAGAVLALASFIGACLYDREIWDSFKTNPRFAIACVVVLIVYAAFWVIFVPVDLIWRVVAYVRRRNRKNTDD